MSQAARNSQTILGHTESDFLQDTKKKQIIAESVAKLSSNRAANNSSSRFFNPGVCQNDNKQYFKTSARFLNQLIHKTQGEASHSALSIDPVGY